MAVTILDGPLGSELQARGVPTPLPLWSAAALESAPDLVAAIHRDYAAAGATVHTANTFRTKRRQCRERWRMLTARAVELCRASVPLSHRIAGSLAPLEDCYRPDLSPAEARPEHREFARALAEAGCDLILVETFAHVGEALVAVEEAVATGVPTWLALSAGPDGTLLTPAELADGAREGIQRGASAVLVNCVGAGRILPFVSRLADLGVPCGAYANAGSPEESMGWRREPVASERYLELAEQWVLAGASLIGGCCGTDKTHIAELARRFTADARNP